jgi:RND family efflux transporter MFP subunit
MLIQKVSKNILLQLFIAIISNSVISQTMGIKNSSFSVQGITEPFKQATISAEFAARILEFRKDEGSFVKQGDTILSFEHEETMLDAERCRIIAESNAELDAAKLKAETAKIDYEATKTVFDSTRSVSKEELWKKELDYNLTKIECERLKMTKAKDLLEYKIALVRLKQHFINAPFDGTVAARYLNPSETCKPQEPLIKIVDVRKCRYITYVPVVKSHGLAKGKKVTVNLNGNKTPQVRQGIIEFISPVVDASSGLRTVKIVFDNTDGSVQPGVTGTLIIEE